MSAPAAFKVIRTIGVQDGYWLIQYADENGGEGGTARSLIKMPVNQPIRVENGLAAPVDEARP